MSRRPIPSDTYAERGEGKCPLCGSWDVVGAEVTIEHPTATQEVTCSGCGFSWLDVYTLTGYLAIEAV